MTYMDSNIISNMDSNNEHLAERAEVFRLQSLIKKEYEKYNEKIVEMDKYKKTIVKTNERLDKCQASCMKILSNIEKLLSHLSVIVYTTSDKKGLG